MSAVTIRHLVTTADARALTANGGHGGSHHLRSAAAAQLKAEMHTIARAGRHVPFGVPVTVEVTCRQATRHRRDPDNVAAVAKPALDGIVQAGLLADDGWADIASITYRVVPGVTSVPRGCIELEFVITEAGDA